MEAYSGPGDTEIAYLSLELPDNIVQAFPMLEQFSTWHQYWQSGSLGNRTVPHEYTDLIRYGL